VKGYDREEFTSEREGREPSRFTDVIISPRHFDVKTRERMVLPGNDDRREVTVTAVSVFSFFLLLFY